MEPLSFTAFLGWLSSIGTNGWLSGFIVNNALLFGIIVAVTPWKGDDKLWGKIKKMVGMNGQKKGEEK